MVWRIEETEYVEDAEKRMDRTLRFSGAPCCPDLQHDVIERGRRTLTVSFPLHLRSARRFDANERETGKTIFRRLQDRM